MCAWHAALDPNNGTWRVVDQTNLVRARHLTEADAAEIVEAHNARERERWWDMHSQPGHGTVSLYR